MQDKVQPDLKQQLADATGIFKGKERKIISEQIAQTEDEISRRLDTLPSIVQGEGYPDVQSFTVTFRKAEAVVGQYNRELAEWERMVRERQRPAKSDPPRSSAKNALKNYVQISAANLLYKRGLKRNGRGCADGARNRAGAF